MCHCHLLYHICWPRKIYHSVVYKYTNKKREIKERYSSLEDIGTLRWELHSKYAAFKFHILRANYVTLTGKRLITSFDPELPDIVGNGWSIELYSIMTDGLPAPESSIELSSCGCKKTNCGTNKCSCRRNNLCCTEACTFVLGVNMKTFSIWKHWWRVVYICKISA